MTYEEKQQAKLERYQELASKNKQQSIQVREFGDRIADAIPLGQPILCGHHSEGRHRRDLDRIHNSMKKSIELDEKAEYYKNKVKNILNPRAISSDDENAIPKLEEKLKVLEYKRDKYKEMNKKARKEKTQTVPTYVLSNLSQNIASVKKRIEHLNRLAKVEECEWTFGENKVKVDKNDNRVRITFPGKPSEEIRTKLKSNGFRWSPYNSAWQRQISDYTIKLAKEIAGEKNEM